MKKRDAAIIALLPVLAAACYFLGLQRGTSRDAELREARARLTQSLHLYQTVEQGDLEKVRTDLGMIVLGQTCAFERRFGEPQGTNSFAQLFRQAQRIATQVDSQLVPVGSVLTNFPIAPDVKVKITK
jgi:hypothetical protein